MGKRTLSAALASELGSQLIVKHSSEFSRVHDLTGVLTNLGHHEFLVIDELEALEASSRRVLCDAIGNTTVTIQIGAGDGARWHAMDINLFCFVGLTSCLGRVDPLIRRWCVLYEFDPYDRGEIEALLSKLASDEGIALTPDAASLLAPHCGGSPGNASVLMKRVRSRFGPTLIGCAQVPEVLTELGFDDNYPGTLKLKDRLDAMDGREFEDWTAAMFRQQGFSVQATAATGDHGIDLILRRDGHTHAVQCKRWVGSVGEPVLRDFYGAMISAKIRSGIVVTSGVFTASAERFADGKEIRLIAIDELLHLGLLNLS